MGWRFAANRKWRSGKRTDVNRTYTASCALAQPFKKATMLGDIYDDDRSVRLNRRKFTSTMQLSALIEWSNAYYMKGISQLTVCVAHFTNAFHDDRKNRT
jgi:hypothetical protein